MLSKRLSLCLTAIALFSGSAMTPLALAQKEATAEVGKPAPPLKATGIDGKTITLSGLNEDGHNVVLVFSRAHW